MEQKLAKLRAKLIANRTATPGKDNAAPLKSLSGSSAMSATVKTESTSDLEVPGKSTYETINPAIDALGKDSMRAQNGVSTLAAASTISMNDPSSAIDNLLAEGQAAATAQEAKAQGRRDKLVPSPRVNAREHERFEQTPTKISQLTTSGSEKQIGARRTNSETDLRMSAAESAQPDRYTNKNSCHTVARTSNAIPARPGAEQNDDTSAQVDILPRITKLQQAQPVLHSSANENNQHTEPSNVKPVNQTEIISPPSRSALRDTKPVTNQGEYERDVELWLQLTGFHDKAYRETRLKTHRIRAQLEQKKRELEQEFAELERQEAAAAQDPAAAKYLRSQSVLEMPPPSHGSLTSVENNTTKQLTTSKPDTPFATASTGGTKRPLPPSNASTAYQPNGKFCRLDLSGRSTRIDSTKPPLESSRRSSLTLR